MVRGANGGRVLLLLGRQLLAEPRHGPIEMMQRQPLDPGDVVVGHPLLASAVGAGHHDPMQHGGKHGAFYRELEAAAGQQIGDHRGAACLLPQPAEQQWRADALARQVIRVASLKLRQDDGAFGVTTDRQGQAFEFAGGKDGFLAAEILDDALLGAAVLADALNEVEVGVTSDALFADEHARLAAPRLR